MSTSWPLSIPAVTTVEPWQGRGEQSIAPDGHWQVTGLSLGWADRAVNVLRRRYWGRVATRPAMDDVCLGAWDLDALLSAGLPRGAVMELLQVPGALVAAREAL